MMGTLDALIIENREHVNSSRTWWCLKTGQLRSTTRLSGPLAGDVVESLVLSIFTIPISKAVYEALLALSNKVSFGR